MSPGLVQLAAVWCAGEPAEEDAERCCSSAHQHTASRPHHSGFASTVLLAASTKTSGVQDCMSGTPIDYVNSTDVPSCLPTFNSSPSMVAIFLQNAGCSIDAYRLLSLLNSGESRCRRNESVEQFCGYSATHYYLPLRLFGFFSGITYCVG